MCSGALQVKRIDNISEVIVWSHNDIDTYENIIFFCSMSVPSSAIDLSVTLFFNRLVLMSIQLKLKYTWNCIPSVNKMVGELRFNVNDIDRTINVAVMSSQLNEIEIEIYIDFYLQRNQQGNIYPYRIQINCNMTSLFILSDLWKHNK